MSASHGDFRRYLYEALTIHGVALETMRERPVIFELWLKATRLELLCLACGVRNCWVFGSVMFATKLRTAISVVLEGLWRECAAFAKWRPSVFENLRIRFVY